MERGRGGRGMGKRKDGEQFREKRTRENGRGYERR